MIFAQIQNIVLEKISNHKTNLGNLFPTYLEKAESEGEYCNSFTNHRNILEKEKHENLAMKIKSVYDIIKT